MVVARRRLRAAGVGVVLVGALVVAPDAARAVETLDQQQLSPYGFANFVGHFTDFDFGTPYDSTTAQTFVAGLTGGLTRAELMIYADGVTHPLAIEVHPVDAGGVPTATVLAATTIGPAAVAADYGSVTFVPAVFDVPAPVVAGGTYALVVRPTDMSDGYQLLGTTTPGAYDDGTMWNSLQIGAPFTQAVGLDLAFKTFVDPAISYDPACDPDGQKAGFNTVLGTGGADVLKGTSGSDLIYGFGGDDVIDGWGGDDLICAGDGNDVVRGETGADALYGGPGRDRLLGAAGNDRLGGGAGDDTLSGSTGRDFLRGGDGNDRLRGGFGRDQLFGEAGDDFLRGGRGRDTADGGTGINDVAS